METRPSVSVHEGGLRLTRAMDDAEYAQHLVDMEPKQKDIDRALIEDAEEYLKITARRTLIVEAIEFGPERLKDTLRGLRTKNDAEIVERGGR